MATSLTAQCPECGAPLPEEESCQSNFHALLYRENAVGQQSAEFFTTDMGHIAHFYAVSCYAIQHPVSMNYTREALLGTRDNLARHVRGETSIDAIRHAVRAVNNGAQRVQRRDGGPILEWHVPQWPYTVADVLAAPPTPQGYADATRAWAIATLAAIAATTPTCAVDH
jgi:hypothetical protein